MNYLFRIATISLTLICLASAPGVFAFGGAGAKGGPGKAPAQSPVSNEPVKVDKATGANAYTVAELFDKSAALDKKKIVVRGKVVKISRGIMEKNWVHLKDGTGEEVKENSKIVVTTQDDAALGDVVTVTGTLHKDKDFGSGYFYRAIVEEGSIRK